MTARKNEGRDRELARPRPPHHQALSEDTFPVTDGSWTQVRHSNAVCSSCGLTLYPGDPLRYSQEFCGWVGECCA